MACYCYALISVSMEVPDASQVKGWIGADSRQNNIVVAPLPKGLGRFWKAGRVKPCVVGFRSCVKAERLRVLRSKIWNASQVIGKWLGCACPLSLQKAVAVMATVDSGEGVDDSPLTSEESKTAALARS